MQPPFVCVCVCVQDSTGEYASSTGRSTAIQGKQALYSGTPLIRTPPYYSDDLISGVKCTQGYWGFGRGNGCLVQYQRGTHSNSPALQPTPCSSRSLSKLTITHNRLTHYASFGALHHLPTHVLQLHSLGSESLRFYF